MPDGYPPARIDDVPPPALREEATFRPGRLGKHGKAHQLQLTEPLSSLTQKALLIARARLAAAGSSRRRRRDTLSAEIATAERNLRAIANELERRGYHR